MGARVTHATMHPRPTPLLLALPAASLVALSACGRGPAADPSAGPSADGTEPADPVEAPAPTPAAVPPAPDARIDAVACTEAGEPGCFVRFEPTTYLRGAQADDPAAPNHDVFAGAEETPREVTVGGFWIQRNEVARFLFDRCVSDGACVPLPDDFDQADINHPVVGLTVAEAEGLCRWFGGRLPTEDEWELAARGGAAHRRFPWGGAPRCVYPSPEQRQAREANQRAGGAVCGALVGRMADVMTPTEFDVMGNAAALWTVEEARAACTAAEGLDVEAAKAALLQAAQARLDAEDRSDDLPTCDLDTLRSTDEGDDDEHPRGLHGFAGNAAEWVSDVYVRPDGTSPSGAVHHVIRGGSFLSPDATAWRTTARDHAPADLRAADMGVRCARDDAP